MRLVFAGLLLIHALIHLLGFVKGFGLAPVAQLVQPISRPVGALWLAACVLLLVALGLLVARAPWWWIPGAAGLLVSQGLIVGAWSDAKFGTVANLLLGLCVLVGFASARFARETQAQVAHMMDGAPAAPGPAIQRPALAALPPALQRFLTRAGVVGHAPPRVVRLRQAGAMQLAPGQGFVDVVAQQYFRVDQPAFLWRVGLALYGLPVVGRDTYEGGHARMRIEAAALLPIVDEADPKIDQGALLRFLGESVWFPGGALSPYITWEPGEDPQQARATMRYQGVEASADFRFDAEGRFTSMRALRYRGGGDEAQLTPWTVRASAWTRFDVRDGEGQAYQVEVPSAGEVLWHLPEGDYVFYRWTVHALEYDVWGPYD